MTNGIYTNLISQLDKLRKHNRQGSIKTKDRYYEAMKRFCRFLAENYRLEKLFNIAPKHVRAYVEYMKTKGLAPSTVMTDLSTIRFWHSKMSNPRHKRLPDNELLNLEGRSTGQIDRTWSEDEYTGMMKIATEKGRDDYVTALMLAYHAGLRIEECFTIDTAMAEKALREGEITFHGKNGRWRTVPIGESIAAQLRAMLKQVRRGSKLLTPDDLSVKNAIYNFQMFIKRHRDSVSAPNREAPMTAHGMRHSYARDTYLQSREQGGSYKQACKTVSPLLGHNRASVTRYYLASVRKDGADI
jgi:site-specific recombinase XerD